MTNDERAWRNTTKGELQSKLDAALARATKAEESYRWMVEHAADQKLDGYRELGAKAAAAEQERDAALARAEAAERESSGRRDVLLKKADELVAEWRRAEAAESALADATALLERLRGLEGFDGFHDLCIDTNAFLSRTPAPAAAWDIRGPEPALVPAPAAEREPDRAEG